MPRIPYVGMCVFICLFVFIMEHTTANSFSAVMVLSRAHRQKQLLQRGLGLSMEPRIQCSFVTSQSSLSGKKQKRKKTIVFFLTFQVFFFPLKITFKRRNKNRKWCNSKLSDFTLVEMHSAVGRAVSGRVTGNTKPKVNLSGKI